MRIGPIQRILFKSAAACLLVGLAAVAVLPTSAQEETRTWPDVTDPGLDLGDFPNSAFTIPKGAIQLEFAPASFLGRDVFDQPQYQTPFLLRFGVTDDVEFRLLGNGLTSALDDPQTTGFSPLGLNSKIHLWDEQRDWLLPASSLEVTLATPWGTPAFSAGYQPQINLNFDFPITEKLNLEWTVGYGGVQGTQTIAGPGPAVAETANFNQFLFQWSLGRDLTDELRVFVTGQTLEAVPGHSGGTILAFGGSWRASDRIVYYSLLGWGTTPDAPQVVAQFGLGIALGRSREPAEEE